MGTRGRALGAPSVGGGFVSRAIRVLIVLTVLLNLLYFGILLLPGDPASSLVDVWLSLVVQWVPVGVFWLVAARTHFARWEVILAAAGMTSNAFGETFYAVAMDPSGHLASPSFADLGYLLYYPLMGAALIVLVRRQSRKLTRAVLFDSTLAVLGSAAVLAVILDPVFADATSGTTFLDGAIGALYPLFDLLLVAVVVGISASPVLRIGPRWQFLVLGLLLFTGADIVYAILNHDGTYAAGTPLDATWTAAVAFTALWVDGVDRRPSEAPTAARNTRLLSVPAIAVLAGLGVLLIGTQTSVPTVALILASAAVALSAVPVMFRQANLVRLLEGREQVVERLEQLDKSKSHLIEAVSHEMRTPLTSILGYLELVLDGARGHVSEDAKDMLRVADRNARRLQNLVGDMLMMTTLESRGRTTITAPVEISRVLRRAAESLRPFASSRGVDVTVVCDESVVVEGDEAELERAFTDVMENAVKFTLGKSPVRVEVATSSEGASVVSIAVTDTGIGVPAAEIPYLFDRFFRATNARDNVVPGTGLGLAIVNGIVEAHRGAVSVASVLGKGTTVSITLPVHQGEGVRADAVRRWRTRRPR
ncbi:sensor histidine kinase [Parafrigoribacterium soli]|uniref:sensor histidine kinase n=1 Tax=Parafrigoribacterium soli TaxID=3144663 RepID=UPI0032EFE82C